jgi:hypothetical protein
MGGASRAVHAVLDHLRRGVRLRRRAHPPRALPALAIATSTVALGHPSGARLLIVAAPDGASPAAWVGHHFAWGTSGAPRALRGCRWDPLPVRRGRHHRRRYNILRVAFAIEGCQPGHFVLLQARVPYVRRPRRSAELAQPLRAVLQRSANPSTDYTWLAAYHLRGAAQTWYFTLVQDEGQPT